MRVCINTFWPTCIVIIMPQCAGCRRQLTRGDVFKSIVAPKVPSHVILVYKCVCGWIDKVVAEAQVWDMLITSEVEKISEIDMLVDFAQWDLEFTDVVGDMIPYWNMPPIIEDHIKTMRTCCDACRRKVDGAS